MSNASLTAAWKYSKSKGAARLVMLAIADEANDQGLCTAYRRSQTYLARKANVTPEAVRKATKLLAKMGELAVLNRGSGRTSSDYQMLLPGLSDDGDESPTVLGAARNSGGDESPTVLGAAPNGEGGPSSPSLPLKTRSSPNTRVEQPTLDGETAAEKAECEFDRFWTRYRRKASKPAARRAWNKLSPADRVAAFEGLPKFDETQPQFVPYPASYLNNRQWENQVDEVVNPLPDWFATNGWD